MPRQSNVPPAQRVELVLAVLRGTERLEVLARRHQVSANTLRRWKDEFLAAGRDRLALGQWRPGHQAGAHRSRAHNPAEFERLANVIAARGDPVLGRADDYWMPRLRGA